MHRNVWRIALFAALCTAGARGPEIANGGFEMEDELGRPAFWYHNSGQGHDHVELKWDDAVAHSGKRSVSIVFAPDYPEDQNVITWMWTSVVSGFQPGHTYRLTAWVRTEKLAAPPTVLVQFRDRDDKFMSRADTHTEYPITGTQDWTQVQCTFQVPENTHSVKIRAALRPHGNAGGTVWFDDLAVSEVATATDIKRP